MARKKGWFNPYDGFTRPKGAKNSHTTGKSKGGDCVATPRKKSLIKARAYRNNTDYSNYYNVFNNCRS